MTIDILQTETQPIQQNRPVVVITGSAGFIGSHLVDALRRDYCVVGMDVEQPKEIPEGTYWLKCDLADDNYPVQIKRAMERLGWYPRHKLRETLPDMVRSLKTDPKGFYEINNLPPPEAEQPGEFTRVGT